MPNDVINTVTVNGTQYNIGGSGGHTIKNPTGTAMTQRSNLQFVDLTISDDSTNDATKVESVHVIQSESELNNLPDGLYMLNEDEGTVIDGDVVGYDNTNSGLNSENVQDAIDEVVDGLNDKADKVTNATNGNLAGLNASGNLTDSGVAANNVVKKSGDTMTGNLSIQRNDGVPSLTFKSPEKENIGRGSTVLYKNASASNDAGTILGDLTWGEVNKRTALNIRDNAALTDKLILQTKDSEGTSSSYKIFGEHNSQCYTDADKTKVDKIDVSLASVSGNHISIPDLKSDQLAKNPIITFEPIQAGSGTPSPDNIRAISGYDKVEVLSCGKNIWADGDVSGTRLVQVDLTIPLEPGTYKFSAVVTTSDTEYNYCLIYDLTNNVSLGSVVHSTENQRVSTTFNITAKCTRIAYYASASWASSADKAFNHKDIQIEKGNAVTDYEPFNTSTIITESIWETIYGGSFDVRTGKFTVTQALQIYDGTSTVVYGGATSTYKYFTIGDAVSATVAWSQNVVSNMYPKSGGGVLPSVQFDGYKKLRLIYPVDSEITEADLMALFTTTPLQIVYELATPFTIQLTPHEISLLKDYAYLSTNGTTITLDYHNGEMASLGDVVQLAESVALLDRLKKRAYQIDITLYNASDKRFDIPCNGYITLVSGSSTSGYLRLYIYDNDNNTLANIFMNADSGELRNSIFVMKGMRTMVTSTMENGAVYYRAMA